MEEATGPCLRSGYLMFDCHPTKLVILSDHVDSSQTGDMAPTLIWRHSVPTTISLPIFLTFLGLRQAHKYFNTNKKLSAPFSRCIVLTQCYLCLTFACYKTVSHERTQTKHVNQWRSDCCYIL